jgi:DNA processing protein
LNAGSDAEALPEPERRARLRLARTDGVGPATFLELLDRFGSAAAALDALPELVRSTGRRSGPRIALDAELDAECEAAAQAGAVLIVWGEAAYPPLLAATDGAPPVFWTIGETSLLAGVCVALVGSRSASAAGVRIAGQISLGLGEAGVVVVSGLARGIDAAAHAASLETGAVAVLAGGVDRPYPPQNLDLYRRIAERGCVISERAMGHEARAADFPRRNRIISGLARGVVVVEAELRSGSLITARLAAEQGREVFAVPGSPLEPRSRGTNDLIRQGASLVEDAADVLAAMGTLPRLDPPRPARRRPEPPRASPSRSEAELRMGDESTEIAEIVERLLSVTPAPIDVLAREARAPVGEVLAALTELSLTGRARLLPGGLAAKA